MSIRKFALGTLTTLVFSTGLLIAAPKTITGVVTDDMCGKKHTMMPGKPDSECIRACVKAGSKYSLLSGGKVLALKGDSKQIDQFAGKQVRVTGEVSGTTLSVTDIAESK